MRAALILLVIAGCVTGPPRRRGRASPVECTTTYAPAVAHTVVAIGMAVGAAALIKDVRESDDPEACGGVCPFFLAQLIAGAPIFGIYAAHSYAQVHACRETKQMVGLELVEDQSEAAAQERRRDAWSMTLEARTAARAGDCDAVKTTSATVLALDAEFHRTVFVRDVAVARCLAP